MMKKMIGLLNDGSLNMIDKNYRIAAKYLKKNLKNLSEQSLSLVSTIVSSRTDVCKEF